MLLNLAPDHLDRHGTLEAYRRPSCGSSRARATTTSRSLPRRARRSRTSAAARGASASASGPAAELSRARRRAVVARRAAAARSTSSPARRATTSRTRWRAAAVASPAGSTATPSATALRTFAGVAHRLEEVADDDGVLYVNDSKATNVASTLVALAAFAARRVHLILGGQGKGQDFAPLRDAGRGALRRASYLIGEDAPALARRARRRRRVPRDCGDLERRGRAAARAAAAPGDVVLLSPACASFDQFADFEARGRAFKDLVRGSSERLGQSGVFLRCQDPSKLA